MPSVQTTYPSSYRKGFPGMHVSDEVTNIISRVLEAGGADIPFGAPVMRGVTDQGCLLAVAGSLFLGVAVRDRTLVHTTDGVYQAGDNVGIEEIGPIWVSVGVGGVTPASVVAWDLATHLWVASATGKLLIPNARFDGTAAAGDVVPLILRSRANSSAVLAVA